MTKLSQPRGSTNEKLQVCQSSLSQRRGSPHTVCRKGAHNLDEKGYSCSDCRSELLVHGACETLALSMSNAYNSAPKPIHPFSPFREIGRIPTKRRNFPMVYFIERSIKSFPCVFRQFSKCPRVTASRKPDFYLLHLRPPAHGDWM